MADSPGQFVAQSLTPNGTLIEVAAPVSEGYLVIGESLGGNFSGGGSKSEDIAAGGMRQNAEQQTNPCIERRILDDKRIEIGVQVGEPGGGSEYMLLDLQAESGQTPLSPKPTEQQKGGRRGRKRTLQCRDENRNQGQRGGSETEKIEKPKGICQHGDCTQEVNSRAKWCPDHSNCKRCIYEGPEGICMRVARGGDPYCITHGGGRRCLLPTCNKSARGKESYCKAHGGGRRCAFEGCTKSAEGKSDVCHTHGGGTRCSVEGCPKAARGATELCISHGGGRRCQHPGCPKGAEGKTDYCIGHGGGVRCSHEGCPKSARGRADFCIAHGGGVRCAVYRCNKSAQGATPLCIAHGGGSRCSVTGCDKGARGASGLCVGHGGGRRCTVDGCLKGAERRSGLCIAHGGGNRCQYEGCEKPTRNREEYCKNHRDQRLVEDALHQIRNNTAASQRYAAPGYSDEYGEESPGSQPPGSGPQSQAGTPTFAPGSYGRGLTMHHTEWPVGPLGTPHAPANGHQYVLASAFGPPHPPETQPRPRSGAGVTLEQHAYVAAENANLPGRLPRVSFSLETLRPVGATSSVGQGAQQGWSDEARGAQLAVDKDPLPRGPSAGSGGVMTGASLVLEAPPIANPVMANDVRGPVDLSLGLGAAPPILMPILAGLSNRGGG